MVEGKGQRDNFTLIMVACMGALLGFVVASHIYLAILQSYYQGKNRSLQTQLRQVQTAIQNLASQSQKQDALAAKFRFISQLRIKSFQALYLLSQVEQQVPYDVSIQQIVRVDNQIILHGESASTQSISQFIKNLNGAKLIAQPVLIAHQKDNQHFFQLQIKQKG